MSIAPLMLSLRRLRPEPWLNVMAAVAVGMFVGYWVIGPVLSTRSDAVPRSGSNNTEAMTFEQMLAQPDPSPYRTPTPHFDAGEPHYADAARAKARAGLGSRSASSDPWSEFRERPAEQLRRSHRRYQVPDRHAIY
jgi:hypothetical protein